MPLLKNDVYSNFEALFIRMLWLATKFCPSCSSVRCFLLLYFFFFVFFLYFFFKIVFFIICFQLSNKLFNILEIEVPVGNETSAPVNLRISLDLISWLYVLFRILLLNNLRRFFNFHEANALLFFFLLFFKHFSKIQRIFRFSFLSQFCSFLWEGLKVAFYVKNCFS